MFNLQALHSDCLSEREGQCDDERQRKAEAELKWSKHKCTSRRRKQKEVWLHCSCAGQGKKHKHTKTQSSRWLPLLLGYNNLARLNVAVCVCGCVYHKTSLCTRCDDLMCTNGTNVGILEFSVCVRAYVCV